ncbi:MAG: bifunctional (p)ppGpp synthetase/guanosine-3',5'-bis(diphosphate) 3'-pyrophosphohydrolase [Bacteroidales bacterium]|nr:bifunctional (p)ppGpp synthetase/guanosine-3',5'-bis(diphosphate) 3'-pyrophosphohydrolase [Bacteroidales bacterium]
MSEKGIAELLSDYKGKEKEIVERSYRIAEASLEGLERENHRPFLEHPVNVALIVKNEIGLRSTSVAAVLLHEASRGKEELLPLIEKEFSSEIVNIVKGLNGISRITPKETRLQAENYRKLIVSYSKDPRVTLIKIADRLEIMRNLGIFPKSSIMRKLTETQMLYIPLAHQLGLYKIKGEMENLFFRYSDPEHYRSISNKLLATEKDREKLAAEFIRPLEKKLKDSGIKYTLKVRTKTAWSIWQKMQKQDVPFEGVYDVFAIRFILDVPLEKEKEACWQVYSLVTQEYKPDVSRLRDWISNPKANGYESLHTTVENKDGARVEVQIRTERMDQMAENGHASHWSYKGIKSVKGLDDWLGDVKKALETPGLLSDGSLQKDLDEIFVFTPNGDLKQLPKGACVLDFAFSIHSNLGMTCTGAKVNGKVKSIREELHTGDVVEIMSRKDQKPSRDWLNIVISSKARSHIKSRLKEEEGKMSRLGREMLERRMKNWKIELTEETLSVLAKQFKFKSIGDFLIAINDYKMDLQAVKDFLVDSSKADSREKDEKDSSTSKLAEKATKDRGDYLVISDKLDNISYKMAKCCNPIFGDDVFGFVTATGGISIHRMSCPNASRLISQYPYRIQKVRWRQTSTSSQFRTGLKVIGNGDASVSNAIMECVANTGASIRAFRISERQKNKLEFVAEMELSVGNKAHLDKVVSALKKLREVTNVLRTSERKR